jgi:hypothetical protein
MQIGIDHAMVDKICVNEARAVLYMALTMNCKCHKLSLPLSELAIVESRPFPSTSVLIDDVSHQLVCIKPLPNDNRYYVIDVTTALVLVAWTIVVIGVMTVVHIPH